MARQKRADRIAWLEKQIGIQESALVTCSMNEIHVHEFLLYRLNKEWCELMEKEFKKVERR